MKFRNLIIALLFASNVFAANQYNSTDNQTSQDPQVQDVMPTGSTDANTVTPVVAPNSNDTTSSKDNTNSIK